MLEQQPELNDFAAAEHPVISSSKTKKTLVMKKQKKKKISFSLGGLTYI